MNNFIMNAVDWVKVRGLKTKLTIAHYGILLAVLALLPCCSGGGGAQSSSVASNASAAFLNTSTASGPMQTIATQIVLDSAVPTQAVGVITRYVSPIDNQGIGSTVLIPQVPRGKETILLALDSSGNIVLAKSITSASTVTALNVDSTALALVKIALGETLTTQYTPDEITSFIKTTTEYINLVTSISNQLDAGVSPANSTAVLKSVMTLIGQLGTNIAGLAKIESALLSSPTVDSSLPFVILSETGAKVSIVSSVSNIVNLTNRSLIQWAASSDNGLGVKLGTVVLPSLILAQYISRSIGLTNPDSIQLLDNGDEFNITIAQSPGTHKANVYMLSENIISLALSYTGLGTGTTSCRRDLVSAIFSVDSSWVNSNDISGVWTAFESGLDPTNWNALGLAAVSCGESYFANKATNLLAPLTEAFGKYISGYSALLSAWDTASLAVQASQVGFEWNSNKTITVCKSSGSIINCPFKLKISPTQVTLNTNQTQQLSVSALDSAGSATPAPKFLEWSVNNNNISVDQTGLLTTIGSGTATVTVKDPVTGVSSNPVTVTVSGPYAKITSASCESLGAIGSSIPSQIYYKVSFTGEAYNIPKGYYITAVAYPNYIALGTNGYHGLACSSGSVDQYCVNSTDATDLITFSGFSAGINLTTDTAPTGVVVYGGFDVTQRPLYVSDVFPVKCQ